MSIEVKICGLTNLDDAIAARDYGADYLGFIMYSSSPRGITASRLEEIAHGLAGSAKMVGVFVNEKPDIVARLAIEAGLHAVQIHGDELASDFSDMPVPVWRAIWVSADECRPEPSDWNAERNLVDSAAPGEYGGTGETADWNRAAEIAAKYPVMLAGGLTLANVADAVKVVHPAGVDISSGIESEPGKKDHRKMKEFIETVKQL
jgi:phosphoribosylanthranilate isomerase